MLLGFALVGKRILENGKYLWAKGLVESSWRKAEKKSQVKIENLNAE
jgi:hypothetical protein